MKKLLKKINWIFVSIIIILIINMIYSHNEKERIRETLSADVPSWQVASYNTGQDELNLSMKGDGYAVGTMHTIGEDTRYGEIGTMDEEIPSLLGLNLIDGEYPSNANEIVLVQEYKDGIPKYKLKEEINLLIATTILYKNSYERLATEMEVITNIQGNQEIIVNNIEHYNTNEHYYRENISVKVGQYYVKVIDYETNSSNLGSSSSNDDGVLLESNIRFQGTYIISGLIEPYENNVKKGNIQLPKGFVHKTSYNNYVSTLSMEVEEDVRNTFLREHTFVSHSNYSTNKVWNELHIKYDWDGKLSKDSDHIENKKNEYIIQTPYKYQDTEHVIIKNTHRSEYNKYDIMLIVTEAIIRTLVIFIGLLILVRILIQRYIKIKKIGTYPLFDKLVDITYKEITKGKKTSSRKMKYALIGISVFLSIFAILSSLIDYTSKEKIEPYKQTDLILEYNTSPGNHILGDMENIKEIDGVEEVNHYRIGNNIVLGNDVLQEDITFSSTVEEITKELAQESTHNVTNAETILSPNELNVGYRVPSFKEKNNVIYSEEEIYFPVTFIGIEYGSPLLEQVEESLTIGQINPMEYIQGNEAILLVPLTNASGNKTTFDERFQTIYSQREHFKINDLLEISHVDRYSVDDSLEYSTVYYEDKGNQNSYLQEQMITERIFVNQYVKHLRISGIIYYYSDNNLFPELGDMNYGIITAQINYENMFQYGTKTTELNGRFSPNIAGIYEPQSYYSHIIQVRLNNSIYRNHTIEEIKSFALEKHYFFKDMSNSVTSVERKLENLYQILIFISIGTLLLLGYVIFYYFYVIDFSRIIKWNYYTLEDIEERVVERSDRQGSDSKELMVDDIKTRNVKGFIEKYRVLLLIPFQYLLLIGLIILIFQGNMEKIKIFASGYPLFIFLLAQTFIIYVSIKCFDYDTRNWEKWKLIDINLNDLKEMKRLNDEELEQKQVDKGIEKIDQKLETHIIKEIGETQEILEKNLCSKHQVGEDKELINQYRNKKNDIHSRSVFFPNEYFMRNKKEECSSIKESAYSIFEEEAPINEVNKLDSIQEKEKLSSIEHVTQEISFDSDVKTPTQKKESIVGESSTSLEFQGIYFTRIEDKKKEEYHQLFSRPNEDRK